MSPPHASESGRDTAWKLNLLSISTDRSRTENPPRELIAASPTLSSFSFAHAASMKKRLSDSISDTWTRRRPSIQQSSSSSALPALSKSKEAPTSISSSYGSSKSRSRSSSAVTPGGAATMSVRGQSLLTSHASSVTLASTTSASSSLHNGPGDLPRSESYSDLYMGRGIARPSLLASPTSTTSSRDGYGIDSPTLYEPTRHASTRSIGASLRDVAEGGEDFQYAWNDAGTRGNPVRGPPPPVQATRPGLVRRISDSKRIMAGEPLVEDTVERNGSRAVVRNPRIYTNALGVPPGNKSESSTVGAAVGAGALVYDHSSDDESVASSVVSVGAVSAASSRTGMANVSYGPKRLSRNAYYPPSVDYSHERAQDSPSSASSALLSSNSRLQNTAGIPASRAVTALPLKHPGPTTTTTTTPASLRPTQLGVDSSQHNYRFSSLTDRSMSSNPHQPPQWSRDNSGSLTRSDSQASMSTVNTIKTTGTSTTVGQVSQAVNAQRSKLMAARDRRALALQTSMTAATSPTGMTRIKRGPPLPDPTTAPDVRVAPTNGMYWYKAPVHGVQPRCWRGHASALLGNSIYVFGGRDMNTCFSDLYVLDADAMSWSKPEVHGDIPPPLRAMTMTPVRNKLVIFGGGDGKYYQNDVWVFDTISCKFTQPPVYSSKRPWPRRAHAACYYKNGIYIFGGGDGVHAMNDVWRLDVTDLNKGVYWKELSPSDYEPLAPLGMPTSATSPPSSSSGAPSQPPSSAGSGAGPEEMKHRSKPPCRGYHTASMIGSNLVIYGGSNGTECYHDVWVFNVEELVWKYVTVQHARQRLCHTATVVGSFLFIVAGHDNVDYVNDVLLLNLVTMTWDSKRIFGAPPSARGYHSTILYDSRLFVIGGYNGIQTFSDTYILELAVSSYYSQISQFTVVLKSQEQEDRQKGWREVMTKAGTGVNSWGGGYGGGSMGRR